MLHFDILTGHPSLFAGAFDSSIMSRAKEAGIYSYELHNLHDYSADKWKRIDDTPYGGGAGMVMRCEPVFDCYDKLAKERDYDEVVYMAADGEMFNQTIANELSLKSNIMILCGHYKGIDERIRQTIVTREISIGEYVLTGGELPAMVLMDATVRLLPGAIGDAGSALTDSYMDGLLEPPIYTKPRQFRGMNVPDVLLSGNHAEIEKWKQEESIIKTRQRRPDLLD